jgi:hypothetical protein
MPFCFPCNGFFFLLTNGFEEGWLAKLRLAARVFHRAFFTAPFPSLPYLPLLFLSLLSKVSYKRPRTSGYVLPELRGTRGCFRANRCHNYATSLMQLGAFLHSAMKNCGY